MIATSATQEAMDVPTSQISDAEYALIRDYFYKRCGIYFDDSKRYFVDKRILSRIRATGCESFRAYFSYLRFEKGHNELQHLVNLLTVNETYFMREEYQMRAMVNGALADIVRNKKKGDLIRIWSLPCSTGEEAYSIAIYLLENWPQLEHYEVEVVGSDIDTRVLEKARRGNYNERSVKNLNKLQKQRYFKHDTANARYQISEDLRDSVLFKQVNLNDDASMAAFKNFDLIYCRNLLIYFDDLSRQQAAERLYDALNPGGVLFLGHSESMSRISSLFKVRRYHDSTGYQKEII